MCRLFKSFTRNQKRLLLAIISSESVMLTCPGLYGRFLPPEATKHGISRGIVGLMFSSSATFSVLFSFLVRFLILYFGLKYVLLSGFFVNGVSHIALGLLCYANKEGFTTGLFIAMAIGAYGQMAVLVSLLTYANREFSDSMGTLVGVFEICQCAAEISSLLLGGLISPYSSFLAPMAIFGSLQFFPIILDIFLLPKDQKEVHVDPSSEKSSARLFGGSCEKKDLKKPTEDTNSGENTIEYEKVCGPAGSPGDWNGEGNGEIVWEDEPIGKIPETIKLSGSDGGSSHLTGISEHFHNSVAKIVIPMDRTFTEQLNNPNLKKRKGSWKIILVPNVLVLIITIFLNVTSFAFFITTLERHLVQFNLSEFNVSLIFVLESITAAISSQFWGQVVDRAKKRAWIMIPIGLLFITLAFCFIGPLPFLNIPSLLWLNCVCVFVLSASYIVTFVAACGNIGVFAIDAGFERNRATFSTVSTIMSATQYTGKAVGPLIGGFLQENLGYAESAGICAIMSSFWGLFVITFFSLNKCKCFQRTPPPPPPPPTQNQDPNPDDHNDPDEDTVPNNTITRGSPIFSVSSLDSSLSSQHLPN